VPRSLRAAARAEAHAPRVPGVGQLGSGGVGCRRPTCCTMSAMGTVRPALETVDGLRELTAEARQMHRRHEHGCSNLEKINAYIVVDQNLCEFKVCH
jgi:hypothetical protein